MQLVGVERHVAYTQGRGAWGVLHVGTVALVLGWRAGRSAGWRLELFTPLRRVRWSSADKGAGAFPR